MNLGKCPDCGKVCSLQAASCPQCGRVIQSGDLIKTEQNPYKSNLIVGKFLVRGIAVIIGGVSFFLLLKIIEIVFQPSSESSINSSIVASIISVLLLNLLLGFLFGYLWNENKWKWGLWLAAIPCLLFISLFALTYATSYLNKGMTVILLGLPVTAIFGGCLGAQLGAILKRKSLISTDT